MHNGKLRLRSTGKAKTLFNIFHNPYDAHDRRLLRAVDLRLPAPVQRAPAGDDQPTARPISMVTGEPINIEAGPNWDDDLGGSPIYAENDPNLEGLSHDTQQQLFAVERLVFFYFPRICNHCLNPSCVAACPSGALYKRGEDGIVLVDQKRCRGWRACVAACPYKKMFFNWNTGKSEKCILCYPATRDRRRRRPASIPASAASATWACCSTTRRGSKRSRSLPSDNSSKASAR